jgi:hypothetical protein
LQKIYAIAFQGTPAVKNAWNARQQASRDMRAIEIRMTEAGLPEGERTKFSNLYTAARNRFQDNEAAYTKTLQDVTAAARTALDAGNTERIRVSADAMMPLYNAKVAATKAKNTIAQMLPDIQEGGPATGLLTRVAAGLKQAGVDNNLVQNIMLAPEGPQKQRLLANQLLLSGMDAEAIESLRAGAGPEFEKAAVLALLKNIGKSADAQIAAFDEASARFQADPLNADVLGTSAKAQKQVYDQPGKEPGARYFTKQPAPGALNPGTVYYVGNQRFVAK